MNENELYRSLNEIDDELLQRSETGKAEKKPQKFLRVLAAAAALLVCMLGFGFLFRHTEEPGRHTSLFIISAYAENGENVELQENDICKNGFSSGPSAGIPYGFDVDMPLFKFDFKSSQWEGERNPYFNYLVDFSYNGKVVGMRDEHLMIGYTVPAYGTGGYFIAGWFEEPTDLEITVRDRESGELLEKTVMHIRYLAEEEIYELTVTEIKTYVAVK